MQFTPTFSFSKLMHKIFICDYDSQMSFYNILRVFLLNQIPIMRSNSQTENEKGKLRADRWPQQLESEFWMSIGRMRWRPQNQFSLLQRRQRARSIAQCTRTD